MILNEFSLAHRVETSCSSVAVLARCMLTRSLPMSRLDRKSRQTYVIKVELLATDIIHMYMCTYFSWATLGDLVSLKDNR